MLVRNYASVVMRELRGRAGEWATRACRRMSRAGKLMRGPRERIGAWNVRAALCDCIHVVAVWNERLLGLRDRRLCTFNMVG